MLLLVPYETSRDDVVVGRSKPRIGRDYIPTGCDRTELLVGRGQRPATRRKGIY